MDSSKTILCIDDNPTNQRLISLSLSDVYKIEQATSGSEGLERLQKLTPSLILLDIDMPGINGFDTCREIRADKRFYSTPIFMISCLTDTEDHVTGYQAGADDYLTKPINLDILLAKIERALQRQDERLENK